MRYFLTTNALKPVAVPGYSFNFEPVGQAGGSWLGILATDDESAANILASGVNPTVGEMTEEQYDAKKKPSTGMRNDSHASVKLPLQPDRHAVVEDAAPSTNLTSRPLNGGINGGPNSTEMLTAVTILSTDRQPPAEPILDTNAGGQRKRW